MRKGKKEREREIWCLRRERETNEISVSFFILSGGRVSRLSGGKKGRYYDIKSHPPGRASKHIKINGLALAWRSHCRVIAACSSVQVY